LPDGVYPAGSYNSGTTSFQATNSITAAGSNGNFTVGGSAGVTFTAGSRVDLKPGFHATAGSSATFHARIAPVAQYQLTVASSPSSGGTVAVWPCSSNGSYYSAGTVVTLTATPSNGYQFVNWNTGSTLNPLYVTMSSAQSLTANFTALSAAPGPVGLVSPVNYAILGSGSTATLTWHAATNATYYDIYLGIVSQSISQVGHIAAPTTQFTVGILQSTSYSWCVVVTNAAGFSTSCANFATPPSGWFVGQ